MNIKLTSRIGILLAVFLFAAFSTCGLCQAPSNLDELLRIQETERTETLSSTETQSFFFPYKTSKESFEWGGWLSLSYFAFDEDDNNKLAVDNLSDLFYVDNRVWFKRIFESGNVFYLRLKSAYKRYDWAQGMNLDGTDTDKLRIGMGYLEFGEGVKHKFRIGRQYMYLGRGLVYSNTHDGLRWEGMFGRWNFKSFFAQTQPNENNIDYSVPGYDRDGKRRFFGLEGAYTTLKGTKVYGYFLNQRDLAREEPENPAQAYKYDSNYLGLGASGFLTKQLTYYGEVVRQDGHSYANGKTDTREQIDAWAALLGGKYFSDAKTHPIFSLEWAYGSGDGDRGNVLTTLNGNLAGTKDRNFLYFGSYDGGTALAPRLSNLSVLRLGFSFKPFEDYWRLRNLTFSAFYSDYTKIREQGVISDRDAANTPSSDVGDAIDLYFKWKIFSDLSLSVNWAKFKPGNAFPAGIRDTETTLITSVTFSY